MSTLTSVQNCRGCVTFKSERNTQIRLRLTAVSSAYIFYNEGGGQCSPLSTFVGEREADDDAGQSPGLPLSELEALFGQDIQALNLETAEAEGDGDSLLSMKWSGDNIRK